MDWLERWACANTVESIVIVFTACDPTNVLLLWRVEKAADPDTTIVMTHPPLCETENVSMSNLIPTIQGAYERKTCQHKNEEHVEKLNAPVCLDRSELSHPRSNVGSRNTQDEHPNTPELLVRIPASESGRLHRLAKSTQKMHRIPLAELCHSPKFEASSRNQDATSS